MITLRIRECLMFSFQAWFCLFINLENNKKCQLNIFYLSSFLLSLNNRCYNGIAPIKHIIKLSITSIFVQRDLIPRITTLTMSLSARVERKKKLNNNRYENVPASVVFEFRNCSQTDSRPLFYNCMLPERVRYLCPSSKNNVLFRSTFIRDNLLNGPKTLLRDVYRTEAV